MIFIAILKLSRVSLRSSHSGPYTKTSFGASQRETKVFEHLSYIILRGKVTSWEFKRTIKFTADGSTPLTTSSCRPDRLSKTARRSATFSRRVITPVQSVPLAFPLPKIHSLRASSRYQRSWTVLCLKRRISDLLSVAISMVPVTTSDVRAVRSGGSF